jgi:ATP-dependent helicase/nuclease subunit A
MTIHKSKGLQFPVVFCLGLEKGLSGRSEGPVILDAELGICLRYKVAGLRLSRKTPADRIFEWKKEHDRKAEKICLLYVAITRAQEKLFLVGTERNRILWDMPAGDHRVLAAADYLDWIMPALRDAEKVSTTFTQPSKPWKIREFDDNQQKTVETGKVIHSLASWVDSLLSAPPVEELWKTFSETKVESGAEEELKKTSVSRLVRNAQEGILQEEEETPEGKRVPDEIRRAFGRYRTGMRLSFLASEKAPDSASRGTVIHRFLSLVDLEEVRRTEGDGTAIAAQRDRLQAEGVFTKEEAAWIQPEKICRFFASPVGRRLLASPEVHREWDFNLRLRDRGMLVQGIMDCAFMEGGGWVLLDYKTDRITDEDAFVEEYCPQLAWYTAALEQLTGKPVRESWLYSLSVDKAFPLREHAGDG